METIGSVLLAAYLTLAGFLGFPSEPAQPLGTLSVLKASQGGTGVGTAAPSDVGKVLKVSDDSPFTYTLQDDNTGAGGSFPFTPTSWGNSTSTVLGNTLGFFANGSSTFNILRAQHATSTNLDVTGLLTFNGVTGSTWASFCTTITGSASLCDGNDATGAGGGGSGNVATSSAETSGRVPFWTSTAGTPAQLSGGVAGFAWNDTFKRLTTTYSSSTALTATNIYGTLTGNADTATALAADPANCSSGNAPLGIVASGAVEGCFDVWTEAENTSAAYVPGTRALTVAGTANQITSSAGLQNLTADRTWTLSLPSHVIFPNSYQASYGTTTYASSTGLTAATAWLTDLFIGVDTLAEYISDTAGAMVSGNTESGIVVTYQDADNTIDFTVDDVTAAMLVSGDFGDFTCNGTTCSLDADTVAESELDLTAVTLADFTNDAGFTTFAYPFTNFTSWFSTSTISLNTAGIMSTASSTLHILRNTYLTNSYASSSYATIDTATTSLFFGAMLRNCTSNNVLTWSNGTFGCEADDTSGASFGKAWELLTNQNFLAPTTTASVLIGTTTSGSFSADPSPIVLGITGTSSVFEWLAYGRDENGIASFGVSDNGYMYLEDEAPAYDLYERDAAEYGGINMNNGDLFIYAGAGDQIILEDELQLGGKLIMNANSINGGLVPDSLGGYDLGSNSFSWNNLYLYTSNCIYFNNKCLIGGELSDHLALQDPTVGGSGRVGITTITPRWALEIATSTKPQLALSQSASSNAWTFRSISDSLYIATSTSVATSTIAAITIDPNGQVSFGNKLATCIALTGSSELCDGTDATGGGGSTDNVLWANASTSPWSVLSLSALSSSTIAFLDMVRSTSTDSITINATSSITSITTHLRSQGSTRLDNMTSALLLTGTTGLVAEYAGSSCTNQAVTSISALGAAGCNTITSAYVDSSIATFSFPFTPATSWTATSTLMLNTGGYMSVASSTFSLLNTDNISISSTGSLLLPTNADPVVNVAGEIALDTTSGNIIFATSTAQELVLGGATTTLYAMVIASTSPDFASGGVIPLPTHFLKQQAVGIICEVDGGTSQQIFLSDAASTNDTNTITCSTTETQYNFTTNNIWTAYEPIQLEFGTKSGAPDYVTIRIVGFRTSD